MIMLMKADLRTDPVHVLSNSKLLRHVEARTHPRQAAQTGNAVCTGHPMARLSVPADDNGLVDSTRAFHFLLRIAPEDIFGNQRNVRFCQSCNISGAIWSCLRSVQTSHLLNSRPQPRSHTGYPRVGYVGQYCSELSHAQRSLVCLKVKI